MTTYSAAQQRARRRQIADAGRRCFIQKTYADTTMDDVIKESGLTAKAVTDVFATKEDIMREVASILMRERISEVEEQTRRRPVLQPTELLRELAIASGIRSQAPLRIHAWSVFLGDPMLAEEINEHALQQHELTTDYARVWLESLGRSQADAELRAPALATVLVGLLHGVLMQLAVDPTMTVPRFIDSVRWVDFAPDAEVLARQRPAKG